MGVRKTESRLPQGLQASDLGEAVVATDGRCALVSCITGPLVEKRENLYVAFVTDAGLAASAASYEWTFTLDSGTPVVQTTAFGEMAFSPPSTGILTIVLRITDAGNAEQATLKLRQEVGPLNEDLETMIAANIDKPGPAVSNIDVVREVVNDHNPYYNEVSLKTPEPDTVFRDFLFGMTNDGALKKTAADRKLQMDTVAASINTDETDFANSVAGGLGVCNVRMLLAVMLLPPMAIPFTELPEPATQNMVADQQIRQKLAELPEPDRIDLFNHVRFPKLNIKLCGQILEALRDRFFSGTSFNDVLTKMSGAMGDWILLNYKKGPLHRN